MPFQGTRGAGSSKAFGLGGKTKPNAPIIGTATDQGSGRAFNNGQASITFTPPIYNGQSTITSYTATASPGGYTGSATSSPIIVTGLQSSTQYTYSVTATNDMGISTASSASNLLTATTVPQAPTIGTVTDGGTGTTVSIPYTAGATGGSAITNYQFISSPATTTQNSTSNPYTFTGLTAGTAYTFTVAAINSNGTSTASSASNSVTPAVPTSFDSIATITVGAGGSSSVTFSSIPNTYKSLQLRYNALSNAQYDVYIKVNSTVIGLQDHFIRTDVPYNPSIQVGSDSPVTGKGLYLSQSGFDSNYPTVGIFDIVDYSNTSKNKVAKQIGGREINGTGSRIFLNSFLFDTTSAISSITITIAAGTISQNSIFALYGIK